MMRSLITFTFVTLVTTVVACGSDSSPASLAQVTDGPMVEETSVAKSVAEEPIAAPDSTMRGSGGSFVPLDNPAVVQASEADYLEPSDRVLGVEVNGESRAYPLNMMTYHHVANDVVGGSPVLVTF